MKQSEWIEHFELVNGRKPTPAEFAQAKAAGEFISDTAARTVTSPDSVSNQLDPPEAPLIQTGISPKRLSKRAKITIFSIVGLVLAIILIVGGTSFYRYQSGKVADGIYEVASVKVYNDDEQRMNLGIDSDIDQDFVRVKGTAFKNYSFYTSSTYTSVNPMHYGMDFGFTMNPWHKTMQAKLSATEFEKQYGKLLKDMYGGSSISDDALEEGTENSVKEYKKYIKHRMTYTKKGDTFTVYDYNKDGKLLAKTTYKKMSEKVAQKRLKDYDKAVKKYDKEQRNAYRS